MYFAIYQAIAKDEIGPVSTASTRRISST